MTKHKWYQTEVGAFYISYKCVLCGIEHLVTDDPMTMTYMNIPNCEGSKNEVKTLTEFLKNGS